MKKILLVGVALVTLAGCSDQDNLQANIPLEEETIAADLLCSNVPIRFANVEADDFVKDGITRGIAGETINYPGLGLFCLGKRPINDGITEGKKPSWSGKSSALINTYSLWRNNIPISLRYYVSKKQSKVLWDTDMYGANAPYYPDKDYFAYGFVLYYPRTENIVQTQTSITAYIKLDGSQRVFYSMAKQPKVVLNNDIDKLGFSKSYYKAIDPEPGVEELIYPYFTFQQLTSGIKFALYSKEEPNTKLHVEKIEFDNFPCIMKLGLATLQRYADKTPYDMKSSIAKNPFILNDSIYEANNLSQFPDMPSWLGHFELYEENGEPIAGQKNPDGSYKYTLTKDTLPIGGTIYIPPVYAGHTKANPKVHITIADEAGNKYKTSTAITLNAPIHGWQRGCSYTYKLYLNNPAEVVTNAEVANWTVTFFDVNATTTKWVEEP